jgi:hypothetical protein
MKDEVNVQFGILCSEEYWPDTLHTSCTWVGEWEYNAALHKLLFMYCKKSYDRRELLYNVLTEFGLPMKLKVR